MPTYKDGKKIPTNDINEGCEICKIEIKKDKYCYCDSCQKYFHVSCMPDVLTRIPIRENTWKCRKCSKCVNCVSGKLDQKDGHLNTVDMINGGTSNPILTCHECNTTSHFKCLPVDVANPIPSIKPDKPIKWKCNR